MNTELALLEEKLAVLLMQVDMLQRDKRAQAQRIALLEADKQRLNAKLEVAAKKIEVALAMMPEGVEA